MGKTFAHLSWLGNVPEFMLLFMSAASIGDNILDANFIIFGPSPSSPVAFDGSKAEIYEAT